MFRKMTALTVLLLPLIFTTAATGMSPDLRIRLSQRFYTLESDSPLTSAGDGFGRTLLDLEVSGSPLEATDLFLLVETAGSGPPEVREMYFDESMTPQTTLRAGRFEVNYGDQQQRRTENANGENNYLIGNFLVDPAVSQSGLEVSGIYGRTGWSFSATGGVESESFAAGRGYAYTGKLWRKLIPGLRASISGYSVNNNSGEDTVVTNFGRNVYGGAVYSGAVENRRIQPLAGLAELDAYQVDLEYKPVYVDRSLEIYGHAGRIQPSGREVDYWSVEANSVLPPGLRVGLRYGTITRAGEERLRRYQLALSRRLNEITRLKLEYFEQKDEYSPAGVYDFEGLLAEAGISWK